MGGRVDGFLRGSYGEYLYSLHDLSIVGNRYIKLQYTRSPIEKWTSEELLVQFPYVLLRGSSKVASISSRTPRVT